jgi:hypothetical protein
MLIIYLERNQMRNTGYFFYPALEPAAACGPPETLTADNVGTLYIKPKRAAKPDMQCNRMRPLH